MVRAVRTASSVGTTGRGTVSSRPCSGDAIGVKHRHRRNVKFAGSPARLVVMGSGHPCGAKFESELYIAGTEGRRPVRRTRTAQRQVESVTDMRRTTTPQVVLCSSLWVCLCTHVVPTQTEVLVNERAFEVVTAQGYLGNGAREMETNPRSIHSTIKHHFTPILPLWSSKSTTSLKWVKHTTGQVEVVTVEHLGDHIAGG